jgi:hypothetical protein
VGRSLRPTTTATARITQELIIQVRRLRTTAIRRRQQGILRHHLVMPRPAILRLHLSLAILRRLLVTPRLAIRRRRRSMPCRPALPLETQWATARSVTWGAARIIETPG